VTPDFEADIKRIARIEEVPSVLEVVCQVTGMRFAAIARVTESRWIACAVLDEIDFGLKPGGELKVESTICHEIRQSREAVVIDHVAEDPAWCNHATPARYGFQSYISIPIILADGSFFGTLCAIDPAPNRLSRSGVIGIFGFFAKFIAKRLDADLKLQASEAALASEREISDLREQFIAVLGHDLRTPMRGILSFSELLLRSSLDPHTEEMAVLIRESARRMNALIDNLLDLARGRIGGLPIVRNADESLEPVLMEVLSELRASHPTRAIEHEFALTEPIECDRGRIAQLVANLLSNALTYGSVTEPVRVEGRNSPNELEISVCNSGEPIPTIVAEHLFEPFYRATLRNQEGLGLGLHISHLIATAHGGTIDVSSTPKETRFVLRIPITADS
jgi:signal transduction histidine kinase